MCHSEKYAQQVCQSTTHGCTTRGCACTTLQDLIPSLTGPFIILRWCELYGRGLGEGHPPSTTGIYVTGRIGTQQYPKPGIAYLHFVYLIRGAVDPHSKLHPLAPPYSLLARHPMCAHLVLLLLLRSLPQICKWQLPVHHQALHDRCWPLLFEPGRELGQQGVLCFPQ